MEGKSIEMERHDRQGAPLLLKGRDGDDEPEPDFASRTFPRCACSLHELDELVAKDVECFREDHARKAPTSVTGPFQLVLTW